MGTGKWGGQGVELLAYCGRGGGAMGRGLGGDGYAEFILGDFQAGGRLEGGVQQRAAFFGGAGIVVVQHSQQLRLANPPRCFFWAGSVPTRTRGRSQSVYSRCTPSTSSFTVSNRDKGSFFTLPLR